MIDWELTSKDWRQDRRKHLLISQIIKQKLQLATIENGAAAKSVKVSRRPSHHTVAS